MNRQAPATFKRITQFADQSDQDETSELVIPEDLTGLSSDDLTSLRSNASEAFEALYSTGDSFSEDELETLQSLATGIEALDAEITTRTSAGSERAEAAAALAARVGVSGTFAATEATAEDAEVEVEAAEVEAEAEAESEVEDVEAVVASGRKEVRVNLGNLRSRAATSTPETPTAPSLRDFAMAAPDVPGFSNGQGMDLMDMGRAVDARLTTFNAAQYEAAARSGRHLRQQFGISVIRKPFEEGLTIQDDSRDHVKEVLDRATDESRLPGGSLVASGGWCAPSETLYDLYNAGESREGLISIPEVGIARGGLRFNRGVDFSTVFAGTGFEYTEAEDIAGDYDGQGGGSKPFYKVPCVEFDEKRLDLVGLGISAGLLQARGYPEVIADTVAKSLIAHDHKVSAKVIAEMVAGSTSVTMPTTQAGAIAPLLSAIELQVQHYRYTHVMSQSTTLEAVFPFWVRGAVRSDLSRRLGVDMIDVSDERINAWFRSRGINPQYVYNWQGIAGTAASGFSAWPGEVKFLLYRAGTWVKGGSDVITLDTVYDSINLGVNDYTALFTEEGVLTAKRGTDSRVVTVGLTANGVTHAGAAIAHNGTIVP